MRKSVFWMVYGASGAVAAVLVLALLLSGFLPLEMLDKVIRITLPVMMLGFALGMVNWARVEHCLRKEASAGRFGSPYMAKIAGGFTLFFISGLAVFALGHVMAGRVRGNVRRFLQGTSSDARVAVAGKAVDEPEQIISALEELRTMLAHHSFATSKIRVEVTDCNQTLVLTLGRDSERHREYWVFYPLYRYTSHNDVGRITTDAFDDY